MVVDDEEPVEENIGEVNVPYELYNKCEELKKKYASNPIVSSKEVNDSVIKDCENVKMDVFEGITSQHK